MITSNWKQDLLLRSYAYGSSFSTAMASTAGHSPVDELADEVKAQLDAQGLDAELVQIDLMDVAPTERRAALESLGVVFTKPSPTVN